MGHFLDAARLAGRRRSCRPPQVGAVEGASRTICPGGPCEYRPFSRSRKGAGGVAWVSICERPGHATTSAWLLGGPRHRPLEIHPPRVERATIKPVLVPPVLERQPRCRFHREAREEEWASFANCVVGSKPARALRTSPGSAAIEEGRRRPTTSISVSIADSSAISQGPCGGGCPPSARRLSARTRPRAPRAFRSVRARGTDGRLIAPRGGVAQRHGSSQRGRDPLGCS